MPDAEEVVAALFRSGGDKGVAADVRTDETRESLEAMSKVRLVLFYPVGLSPHGLQGLSSPTRAQAHTPCNGSRAS